jgi:Na+/H+-dicarboxylate symporter
LQIGKIISNDVALVSGLALGILGNFVKIRPLEAVSKKLLVVANFILKRVICAVLPLFILGFILKMQHEGALGVVIREYMQLLVIMVTLTYGYMFSVLFFLSQRKLRAALEKTKNLMPGILIGFFGMSSFAAIPATVEGCKKNLKNQDIASFVVPAAANMHLLGDTFALPIIGLALMVSFGFGIPTPLQYLVFALRGVVAKFAAAGIPGGSAIIFSPIFEHVFGFSGEMLAAVTAIYVLFDPFATSANVYGHGIFASLFERVYCWVFRKNKGAR